jgi:hypothetical protein
MIQIDNLVQDAIDIIEHNHTIVFAISYNEFRKSSIQLDVHLFDSIDSSNPINFIKYNELSDNYKKLKTLVNEFDMDVLAETNKYPKYKDEVFNKITITSKPSKGKKQIYFNLI